MLKIEANKLHNFIGKVTANGLVHDCKLSFDEKGLQTRHKDTPGIVYIAGFLNKDAFKQYEPCELDIKDTAMLLGVLKSFGDEEVQIVKQDNMAKFMTESSNFELALAEKIECYKEGAVPKIEYDNSIVCKKSIVEKIIQSAKIVKSDIIKAHNKEGVLTFKIGEDTDKASVNMKSDVATEKSTTFDFKYFDRVTGVLDLVFDFCIGDDGMPAKFLEKTDQQSVLIFLSSMQEE